VFNVETDQREGQPNSTIPTNGETQTPIGPVNKRNKSEDIL